MEDLETKSLEKDLSSLMVNGDSLARVESEFETATSTLPNNSRTVGAPAPTLETTSTTLEEAGKEEEDCEKSLRLEIEELQRRLAVKTSECEDLRAANEEYHENFNTLRSRISQTKEDQEEVEQLLEELRQERIVIKEDNDAFMARALGNAKAQVEDARRMFEEKLEETIAYETGEMNKLIREAQQQVDRSADIVTRERDTYRERKKIMQARIEYLESELEDALEKLEGS